MRTKVLAAAVGVGAVLAALSVAPTSAVASSTGGWSFIPVATHLNEPRGIDFDNQGNLYVAEAGYAGSGSAGVTRTGAVDKFVWGGSGLKEAWSTPFTSIFAQEGGETAVLGPAAVSASGRGCNLRDTTEERGCLVQALLSESRHGIQAQAGFSVPQIGHLYKLNGVTGSADNRSDVGDQMYAWTGQHKQLFSDFPDSNPYGILTINRHNVKDHDGDLDDTRTFVADAGANTISEILPHGYARVIAYIPNETSGAMRDATPTCIAQGPDGMLYVGALDLVSNFSSPNQSGQSNVWRVNPNSTNWRHNAKLWATGYTTINGCTFDKAGNFWASELFYPNSAGPPGDLAMAPFAHPNAIHHIGLGSVPLPGGIAQGPDGAMYVSVGSADPAGHTGAIMRVQRQ